MGLVGWLTGLGRRRRSATLLAGDWEDIAGERLWLWPTLDGEERGRLQRRMRRLLDKRWEASRGFAIDDTMRITIAAHAALLALGREEELFRNVTAVVVHPTTMVLREERPGPSPWVRTDAPLVAHGHTSSTGPVFLAWREVERTLRHPDGDRNVILHEFAHKIDALNGMLDGTPPLDAGQRAEWREVCSVELAAQRRGDGALRSYAATNPSEFFAVATEVFFQQPRSLRETRPRLYDVLSRFYRQDPAARQERLTA